MTILIFVVMGLATLVVGLIWLKTCTMFGKIRQTNDQTIYYNWRFGVILKRINISAIYLVLLGILELS